MPPDRVGVARTLRFGHTLKRVGGGYDLDLSLPGSHKTRCAFALYALGGGCQYVATRLPSDVRSATFGPSRTALSQPIVGWIHKYIEIKTTASAPDSDFLFPSAADPSKPLSPSAWTRLVKAVYKRHSGVPLCPKASLLRFSLLHVL